MDALEQRTLTARKEHQCNECLGIIGIGDSYERARIVDGRDYATTRLRDYAVGLMTVASDDLRGIVEDND